MGYGLEDQGSRVRFLAGVGNFSLHRRVQNGSDAHPASYPIGRGALSLGVKRPEREADHPPPSSVGVKECVELYLHSQYVFIAWCLVKHRDKFTFTILYEGVSKSFRTESIMKYALTTINTR
jgi:hypothetical protein